MYAETAGGDVTERAVYVTDMLPEGRGLADTINGALHNACLTSRDVDFVNAHEHLLRKTMTWRR
jgi:3-oxoacyl-(acyl-carrier-protein) synthase